MHVVSLGYTRPRLCDQDTYHQQRFIRLGRQALYSESSQHTSGVRSLKTCLDLRLFRLGIFISVIEFPSN